MHMLMFTLLIFVLGCSGGEDFSPELGTVTGVITLNEKPLANAVVTFLPQDTSSKYAPVSGGLTDAEGKYTLKFKNGSLGALPGSHSITISTDLEGTNIAKNEKVPAKYNKKTKLVKTVELGENTINFDLKSK